MNTLKDELRYTPQPLIDALIAAGARFITHKKIGCPFHEDKNPSANIHQDKDGVWRFYCHGPCDWHGDVFDVRARHEGKSVVDVLRELGPQPIGAPETRPVYATIPELLAALHDVSAHFIYANPDTRDPELIVVRCQPSDGRKTFIQCRPVLGGGFCMEAPPKPWPLYNRSRVRAADHVVVVEGEKCVHALAEIGIVATTSPGGAKNGENADWSPLAGKTVYLWPDADPPNEKGERSGIIHMRTVQKIMHGLKPMPRLMWIDCDSLGLPPKGDVVDYLDRFNGDAIDDRRRAVQDVLDNAESTGASGEVGTIIADAIAGRRRTIPWPWPVLGRMSRALAPATVTLLVAGPGATKSLMLIQAGAFWHQHGFNPAILELEDGRAFHLRRALSQRVDNSELTDDEWVKANPDASQAAHTDHTGWLDSFGACIHELPGDSQPTFDAIADWVEDRALVGHRVIAVDPLSIAATGHDQFIADQKFIARVKKIVEQAGVSLVLVMHPRKGATDETVDDVAGGAAYGRLAQTVLWIKSYPESKTEMIYDSTIGVRVQVETNRIIRISKARNGPSAGMKLAMRFNRQSLTTDELGIICKGNQNESD